MWGTQRCAWVRGGGHCLPAAFVIPSTVVPVAPARTQRWDLVGRGKCLWGYVTDYPVHRPEPAPTLAGLAVAVARACETSAV